MADDLTIVTWLWHGWRPVYKPEHVYRMREMLSQHLSIPHRFVCVTDRPEILPGVDTVKLWPAPRGFQGQNAGEPSCYARLRLHSAEMAEIIGKRILSIDLDAIILDDFADLLTDAPFQILANTCCPYNGSMWLVEPGAHPECWHGMDRRRVKESKRQRMPDGKRWVGSDQAFMAYMVPNAPTWPIGPESGIYWRSRINGQIPEGTKIIFFPGREKPWDEAWTGLYDGSMTVEQWNAKSSA
jgi:hypothetical protein